MSKNERSENVSNAAPVVTGEYRVVSQPGKLTCGTLGGELVVNLAPRPLR
jgi:hypothetical protein